MIRPLQEQPRAAWRAWEQRGASPQVVDWLREGVKPEFEQEPIPFDFGSLMLPEPAQRAACQDLLQRYLQTGAVRRSQRTKFVSRSFLIPKRTGGFRLIIDLRPLNRYCRTQTFKYHTLHSLHHVLEPADWMVAFDLQDGYHHVGIHPDYQHYFCFAVEGQYFQCSALPFGWSASPAVFTEIMRAFVHMIHEPQPVQVSPEQQLQLPAGVRVSPYLDDFLLMARSQADASLTAQYTQALMKELGLSWHPEKSAWTPAQQMQHLGLTVDSSAGKFYVPADRLTAIRGAAQVLLATANRNRRWVPARELASFTGKAAAVILAMPSARFFSRSLHDAIATRNNWGARVKLSHQALKDLLWWRRLPAKFNGGAIWTPASHATIVTDASDKGWGAICDGQLQARGAWTPEQQVLPIAVREMLGLSFGVRTFADRIAGQTVRVRTDSIASRASAARLTSTSPAMMRVVRALHWTLDRYSISLLPEHVPGVENSADALSRWVDKTDWQLTPRKFAELEQRYGPHSIDRFASHSTAQLKRFNSLFLDPCSSGVDAFAQRDWEAHNNYCFPPFSQLPQLISLLRACRHVKATIIAPYWPTAPWMEVLLHLADEFYIWPAGGRLLRLATSPHLATPKTKWPLMVCRVQR